MAHDDAECLSMIRELVGFIWSALRGRPIEIVEPMALVEQ